MLCNTGVKSQISDLEERTQKEMTNTVNWLYDNFENFDRECFLTGTFGMHYQTFTANKSIDDIDHKVKWLFEKDLPFIPDTMRCRRITTYEDNDILALFITTLFKNDYPELQALRVCSLYPLIRHYGSEVKTTADPKDPFCNLTKGFEIELFSSFLAKTAAGYYNFDYDNLSAVSSGGDIGYGGVINKEKIVTEAQKMSFLAGIFMRYEGHYKSENGRRHSIMIPDNMLSAAEEYIVDLLKEFGCDNVEKNQSIHYPKKHIISFIASDKIRDLIFLLYDLFVKTMNVLIAF
jgi:hypothetical protein